jgi:Mrp family chromosome partitioning ATPase
MSNWEERFTAQQKDEPGSPPRDMQETRPVSDVPRAAGSGEAAQPPLPPTFAQMRRHLDDIWSNLLLEARGKPNLLLLCGSTTGEGCTFLSFHLALFLAEVMHMKTLYVDTAVDVPDHLPCVPGMYSRPGLASFFNGDAALPSLIASTDYPNLCILTSGAQTTRGPSIHKNIISGHYIEQLVSFCKSNYDITVFDGQPIASRPVSIEFAKRIEKVVLVCRYGISRREVSMVSAEKLRKNGITITGIILNDRQFPVPPEFYNILR